MFDLDYEDKLKKKVSNYVQTKIKNIKSVDDIKVCDIFEALTETDVFSSYDRLRLLKKITQITINIYNHYDVYKDLRVKFFEGNQNNLMPLYHYYKYNSNDGVWKCTRRPEENHVTEALYNYVLCFESLQMKDHDKYDEMKFDKCYFCDNIISEGEDSCSTCNSSIAEMSFCTMQMTGDFKMKSLNKENLSPYIDCDNHNLDSLSGHSEVNYEASLRETKSNTTVPGIIDSSAEIKDQYGSDIQWRCCNCQSRLRREDNPALLDTEGLNDRERMICEGCVNAVISKSNEDRNISETRNYDNISRAKPKGANGVNMTRERTGRTKPHKNDNKQWRCASCNLLNLYNTKQCNTCKKSMKENGRWICTKCTFENRFNYSKCEACSEDNHNLVIKFCQFCKVTEISKDALFCYDCINESRMINNPWNCRYIKCGADNDMKDNFCTYCGLWKFTDFGFLVRGQAIRRFKYGNEEGIWICSKCFKFTNVSTDVCSAWFCWETRYKKKECKTCKCVSDGKSNYCRTCKTILE